MKVPTILIVGAVFAVVASASQAAVFSGGGQPAQTMSQPQHAVMLRSEALNRKYHLGAYAVARLDPAIRTVVLRNEAALNRQHRLGAAATSTNAGSGSGFAWDIAAVGGVLLLLLVGATTLVRRPRASVKTSG